MSGIRRNSGPVTTGRGKFGIPDTTDDILNSAKWTSEEIRLLNGAKPLTEGDIESVLRHGNSALKNHLPVPINLRNSGKEEWVKTILAEFNINPDGLKCTDKEITKLIPEMADLIFDKLTSNQNSESSGVLAGSALVSLTQENPADSLEHLSVKVVNLKDLLAADFRDHLKALSNPSFGFFGKVAAAKALYNLSEKVDNHEALLYHCVHSQLGLLLVDSQATHCKQKCAEYAAKALNNLSKNSKNDQALMRANVHTQLVALLSNPQATADAKKYAAMVLMNLSAEADNHQALVAAGVHTQLVKLLSDPKATADAKEYAAEALMNLSKNEVIQPQLLAADVHAGLVGLLSNPQATADAKKYAAMALMNLSAEADNHQALVAAGVHTQLVKLLSDPKATADAKEYAVVALMNLSKNEAIQPQLLAADVHAGLVGLLSNPNATAGAKEIAAKALCNLLIGAHAQLFALVRDPKATHYAKEKAASVVNSVTATSQPQLLGAGVHTQLVKRLFVNDTNPDSKKSASMALWNLMTKRPMTHSQEQSFNRKRDGTMFMGKSNWFGKRSEGITITKNGQIFEGVFKYGKLEGKGTFTSPDGTSITGEFRNGQPIGVCTRRSPKGKIFEGCFKDGNLEGKGTVTYPDGTSIIGEFRSGQPIGVCTRTRPNGRKTEYQATYTGDDKNITKEELNRRMAAPQFAELLTGVGDDGAIRGYVLPLISTHLKYLAPTTSPMEKLASQLDFAAEIENEEASVSIEKIKERLHSADNEVVIPYGRDRHAMLLKLKFTDLGLNVEIYNSGEGVHANHEHHPQSEVNKYNTCKEKFYPKMRPDSTKFNSLLTDILEYKTFQTIDKSYAVFAGAQDVVSVAPNWQRKQKAGNCALECVMAFLKKNMPPADYLQYRMTLISDVKTQAEDHKDSYEEKLDPKAEKRLDEMLENRKVKQSGAVAKQKN